MDIRIIQIDSFTRLPFRGNPAGVCLLHEPMPTSWMQQVANEMNLSETAFLLPEEEGYNLRWFTPTVEVDLCGHATLASAHALWSEGDLAPSTEARFSTRSGLLTALHRANSNGESWIELNFPVAICEPTELDSKVQQALGDIKPLAITHTQSGFLLVEVADEEEVKANWEKLKLKEGHKSVLSGVPRSLPSLVKAERIQDKARGVGFDWDKREQVWEKVQEELHELKSEVDADSDRVEEELGDVLFSIINYARFIGVSPDQALERTNKKFISRFKYLEEESKKDGKKMGEMSLEEMDVYWNRAKEL